MQSRTIHALKDVASSCEEILEIVNQPALPGSERLKALASERLLLIIGEALTRIRGDEPNVFDSVPSGAEIIGMRNVIVHGYDVLDQNRIQDAVRDDLPQLLNFVRELLGE
jgi:uncharacterized protein with HEPN domain